jgi:hypothetical protein
MNNNIKKALDYLEEANYAGYFEEMDKITMPPHLKPVYAQHKSIFIAGAAPYNFHQILTVFAKDFDLHLSNENPKTDNPQPSKPKNYNLANINKLLMNFSDEDINRLAMFNFEQVFNNFAAGQTKQQKVMALLDYCKRFMETEKLLDAAKDENPAAFEQFKPYC